MASPEEVHKDVAFEIEKEKERHLLELYNQAKDENELLEFKNYELMFKIQELELAQKGSGEKASNQVS